MLAYNKKSPAKNTGRKTEKGTSDVSCCYFYKQEHYFLQPASTPTGKKEIETLQLNCCGTNILLLPHTNSPESTAALPATAISPSNPGQARTQMCSSFIWKPDNHQVELVATSIHSQSETPEGYGED